MAAGPPDQEVERLKREPGKDMVIFGSASLAQSFMRLDLIDEYWLFVTPVALGSGKPLFKNIEDRIALELAGVRSFETGVVLLRYEPIRDTPEG